LPFARSSPGCSFKASSIFFPAFDAPPWMIKAFIVVIILCFPIALALSWAFEITAEGIKLESEIAPNKSISRRSGHNVYESRGGLLLHPTIKAGPIKWFAVK
jgi:hypothetical protein